MPGSATSTGATVSPSRPSRAGPSLRPSCRGMAAVRIGTGRDRNGGERRAIRIDGEPVRSQSALAELVGVLWLTPQMDRLFVEGPEGRRRFMDRLVLGIDPAHAARVGRYEQAMRERSRLLREGRDGPGMARRARRVDGDSRGRGRGGAARCDRTARPCLRRRAGDLSARPGLRRRHGRDLAGRDAGACRRGSPSRGAGRGPAGRRGVGRRRDRAASLRPRGDPRRKEYRRRGGLDRRAEGAADRHRARAGASCSSATAASRRCCCSTRWWRISMRRAARRCSSRSPGSTARRG